MTAEVEERRGWEEVESGRGVHGRAREGCVYSTIFLRPQSGRRRQAGVEWEVEQWASL